MDYSKAFRIVRAAFGLSQAEFSRLINIGPSQVSLIEAGKRQPSHKTIKDLSDALHIPASLITLLASDSKNLSTHGDQPLEALAISLLKLLVSASDEGLQTKISFPNKTPNNE